MRLPLTTTVPLATGKLLARMLDVVLLGGVELDDGAAAEPEHLVDRHRGRAEHHRDVDANLVERAPRWLPNPPAGETALASGHHGMVNGWLTSAQRSLTFGLPHAPERLAPVEWRVSDGLVAYEDGASPPWRRAPPRSPRARAPELVWLLEHPPLYTAGTSAHGGDLIEARFPVFETRPRRAVHLSRARASASPM